MTPATLAAGQVLRLGSEPLSEARIRAFAVAGADLSPTHLSDEAARAANFPNALAHGMLGMAFLGRLLLDHFPQAALTSYRARFVAMTFHGDHLTCEARIDRIARDENRVDLTLSAVDQSGRSVITGSASLVFSVACG